MGTFAKGHPNLEDKKSYDYMFLRNLRLRITKNKKSPTVPYLVGDYNKLVNKFMLQELDQKQSHLREGAALPMPYP